MAFKLDLPPPPKPKSVTEIPGMLPSHSLIMIFSRYSLSILNTHDSEDTISVIFKSTKPARTFTFPVALADPISSIKSQLALQPGAPPADAQRLLLRGKALSDVKLLQEYAIKDGDTITLMLRPGFEWDWGAAASSSGVSGVTSPGSSKGNAKSSLEPGEARPKHGRIPSVVLSPSPSTTSLPLAETPAPIPLTLDTKNLSPVTDQPKVDAYNKKVASPEFWDRLYGFLRFLDFQLVFFSKVPLMIYLTHEYV